MEWQVEFHRDFKSEYLELSEVVQDEIAILAKVLQVAGPRLKRPASDTLNGSKHANMKELRVYAD